MLTHYFGCLNQHTKRSLILIIGAPKFGPSELAFIFEDSISANSCINLESASEIGSSQSNKNCQPDSFCYFEKMKDAESDAGRLRILLILVITLNCTD